MEYLIKCYLDQLSTCPRNTFHDRRKRRSAVDYISTLIKGCIRGQNSNPEATVREAIMALMSYHEENRIDNSSICMMGKFHNVLYVAVKLCYDWQLKDTATVVTLLEHIYSCERSFERIFIGAIVGNKASHCIVGWKSDFDSQEEILKALVYFIDHATKGWLQLDSVRFIDAPIETCGKVSPVKVTLQLGLPDGLHILLRYGALVGDNSVELLLRRLMESSPVYPDNIIACLQLVLRVVPSIDLDKEYYTKLVEDALIPLNRCGVQVPELKHISRCCIRKRLWENYQLPNGIASLPVPDCLKRYIDIMED